MVDFGARCKDLLHSCGQQQLNLRAKSPRGWDSTMQAILMTAWRCLGLGTGAAVGGWVMDRYGARFMYRGASIIVGCFFCLHVIIVSVAACCKIIGRTRRGDSYGSS